MFEHEIDIRSLADLKRAPGTDAGPVEAAMFGAIHSNVLSFSEFVADHEALGLTGLRFPGGSVAENDRAPSGDWLYDPALYETGFHPSFPMGDRASLADMLALAAAKGVPLSLTVPVERFFGDPASAEAWMAALLERLAGMEGAPPVTLDIGNEAYSDPAGYGAVAAAMLRALRAAREEGLEGVEAGVQVMHDAWGSTQNNAALIEALRGSDPSILAEIDAVRMHALDLPMRNATRYEDVRARLPDLLMRAVEVEGGAPELHVSAWAVRGDDALPEGWQGPSSAALASSGAMLSLFSGLLELGAVRADAWGLAVSEWNRTALSFDGEGGEGARAHSPHAVTLALMAESVVGLSLVDDGRLDAGLGGGPIVQTYAGEGTVVLFLSAGDIDGPQEVVLGLEGIAGRVVGAVADRVALIDPGAEHAGAAHALREAVDWSPDGTLRWTFREDWETVRIVLETTEANAAPVLEAAALTVAAGGWVAVAGALSMSDLDGDAALLWELRDAEGPRSLWSDAEDALVDASGGYTAAALGGLWLRGDADASVQEIGVRVHDGEDWSAWEVLTLTTLPAPETVFGPIIASGYVPQPGAGAGPLGADPAWQGWDGIDLFAL